MYQSSGCRHDVSPHSDNKENTITSSGELILSIRRGGQKSVIPVSAPLILITFIDPIASHTEYLIDRQ